MKTLTIHPYTLTVLSLLFLMVQCKKENQNNHTTQELNMETKDSASITKESYGITNDGQKVDVYTLKNDKGMEVEIITYGGIITSLKTPDKNGEYQNIVLGYDSLSQYIANNPYFGAIIGRYGNRIAKGKFSISGKEYTLETNNGSNHLHGGNKGFDKVVWDAEPISYHDSASLKLTYTSKDMEEGYPGNLTVAVTYTLANDNSLAVSYEAITDEETIVNLTQHSYFNLSGDFNNPILDHQLTINADKFLPVDSTLIPTGQFEDVTDTPFDFRNPKTVEAEINVDNDQLKKGLGYDHCWVLNDQGSGVRFVASAYHPESGRFLEVYSDEPGLQFYSGNFLDGTLPMKGGIGTYKQRTGFCLETQHYPDSPNQETFPSVSLSPGEKYTSKTSFRFSVK